MSSCVCFWSQSNPTDRSSRRWAKTKPKKQNKTEKQPQKVAQPQIIALLLWIDAKVLAVWPPPPTRQTLQTQSSTQCDHIHPLCLRLLWSYLLKRPKNSMICFLSTEASIFRGSICGSSSPQLLLPCPEEDDRGANKARLWLTWFYKQKPFCHSPPCYIEHCKCNNPLSSLQLPNLMSTRRGK